MSEKEPGQRLFEAYEAAFVADSGPLAKALPWDEYANKDFWARTEARADAPLLAEIERLKARVAELERERDVIVGKLGEAVSLASLLHDMSGKWGYGETLAALKTYHASLTWELPPDLPLRTLDAARIPDLNRDEHLDRPKPERDHVHEVGSCSFCDRALRQGATPCLTWQGPEYGGGCRACGGSKEEHEGRS